VHGKGPRSFVISIDCEATGRSHEGNKGGLGWVSFFVEVEGKVQGMGGCIGKLSQRGKPSSSPPQNLWRNEGRGVVSPETAKKSQLG